MSKMAWNLELFRVVPWHLSHHATGSRLAKRASRKAYAKIGWLLRLGVWALILKYEIYNMKNDWNTLESVRVTPMWFWARLWINWQFRDAFNFTMHRHLQMQTQWMWCPCNATQRLVQLVLRAQAELMKLNKETDEMRKEAICVVGIDVTVPLNLTTAAGSC